MGGRRKFNRWLSAGALAAWGLCQPAGVLAQIVVTGVTDKATYVDQATFTITQTAGWNYGARLDAVAVPLGVAVAVGAVDYHELFVTRTNNSTSAVETLRLRFVIRAAARADTENGLPPWTPPRLIPSSPAEFMGAQLQIITPAAFPTNVPIPVVAWALNGQGHAVRANGSLTSPGHPALVVKRGVGSGFLGANNPPGPLNYDASLAGLQTNRSIQIESKTTWQSVSGTLNGHTVWPANSRLHVTNRLTIPAGSSLVIGAGTLVRLASQADIKLDGAMAINGTVDQPVVFFPANPAQPWGGFLLELNSSQLIATGTIFTGSGADANWFGSNGRPGSHRREQALFYCTNAPTLALTDCAAIYLAGQLGHCVNGGTVTLTRFLMQRATSGGEFTGAHFVMNDCALIECPDDSTDFVDGDNDAIYFVNGTHGFTNTLFGWTKDDGVDSGGSGAGLLEFQNCWFESIFHEGNSLSGNAKFVNHHQSVFLNCGQGLESGYEGPVGALDGCLLLGNQTGGRFGDNYADRTYTGSLRATNSILLHNYRDVWGVNFQDWLWRTNAMNVQSNWFTAAIPQHPNNFTWQPDADAARLTAFMTTPPDAPVGLGLAANRSQFRFDELAGGLEVRLSTFTTNRVSVGYAIEVPGLTVASGRLEFSPGEMARTVPPVGLPFGVEIARVILREPTNAEVTGLSAVYGVQGTSTTSLTLVSTGANWRYLDTGEDAGTNWRSNAFNAASWSNGIAELGYGEGDEATPVRSNSVSGRIITTYFRHAFNVETPEAVANLTVRLKRDDGGIVYLNGAEIFRSNLTNASVDYLTRAVLAADDGKSWFSTNAPPALLLPGTNLLAVEIHQESPSSSDVSFDLSLEGAPRPTLRAAEFSGDRVLWWEDGEFLLEQTTQLGEAGVWTVAAESSPAHVAFEGAQRFYRLRKKS